MGSVYKRQLNEWKSTLEVKAKVVFDIGGAQDPIKGKVQSWDVERYKIVDLETPHVQDVPVDIVQDMNKEWTRELKADVIFCLGVFDYVINPNIAMDNIYKMLKDDGYAWIEFPFVYAHHNPLWDEGCRYSEGCVTRLADQAGLKITDMIRKRAENGHLVEFYRQDGHRMAREYPYHDVTGFIVRFEK